MRVLIEEEAIAERVTEIAHEIERDHPSGELVLIAVLTGSFVFVADLARQIRRPLQIDFLRVRSYENGTESSGVVEVVSDLASSIAGKHVVLVEDIVDTGLTMSYLLKNIATRLPKSLRLATLLHKPSRARVEVPIDYLGFTIEDVFAVGYGLDLDQHYRNLPYVAAMDPQV